MTDDIARQLIDFRRELHANPELSDVEKGTAGRVATFLKRHGVDEVVDGIGGNGMIGVYRGEGAGPTTMIRCELDALPIAETGESPHRSRARGVAHSCGHDGHIAIVSGVGAALGAMERRFGDVALLFQPAEETGQGALRVIGDPLFGRVKPNYIVALHNLPGYSAGAVLLRDGIFAAASKGMRIMLVGRTSHAAHPEEGRSPAGAVADIIRELTELPRHDAIFSSFTLLTITHVTMGERSFGITPGSAEIMATLRSYRDDDMETLSDRAEAIVNALADRYGLRAGIEYSEIFPATVNHPDAIDVVRAGIARRRLPTLEIERPFRWSEDFGQFATVAPTALFGLGAGADHPGLHDSSYDFPDDIIPSGVAAFLGIVEEIWTRSTTS